MKRTTTTTARPAPRAGEPRAAVRLMRCAIYTRKSSEEGLEQEFNSPNAQRGRGSVHPVPIQGAD
jgi:site-specific DNA recombinase